MTVAGCVIHRVLYGCVVICLVAFSAGLAGAQTCSCPNQADVDGDGGVNSNDLGAAIDIIVFGDPPPPLDPDCPRSRLDLDCDSVLTTLDIEILIGVVFFQTQPCDPCQCLTDPPSCDPNIQSSGSVVVESKTVSPGEANVEVGVYIDNPVGMSHLAFPLEIREVSGGAYPTGTITAAIVGRLSAAGLDERFAYYANPDVSNSCSGPTSNSYSTWTDIPITASAPNDGVRVLAYSPNGGCFAPGSDGVPGSGTPSITLTFDVGMSNGVFEIDTCCTAPSNHLLFAECASGHQQHLPSFTKGVITVGEPLTCKGTITDNYLLACPRGDIPFTVQLIDQNGNPVVDYSDVTLDFSDCLPSEFFPAPGLYPSWPVVSAPSPSDANGEIVFQIAAASDCPDCSVTVSAACGFSRTVPVRSTDVDGDAWVLPVDHNDALGLCRDLNADGDVDDMDYERHLAHCCDHRFPAGPCDWLSQDITLDPDGGFSPTDEIDVLWSVHNNEEGDVCTIDSVQIYESEWTPIPSWQYVATLIRGATLNPGEVDKDSLNYTVPDFGKMCLRTLMYTSCCATPQEEVACVDVNRQCPPDAVCFFFRTVNLADADTSFVRHDLPIALGWSYVIVQDADTTNTTICTSDITPAGTGGTLTHYYQVGGHWRTFTYRVVQELFKGDMSGNVPGIPDCIVNSTDLNFLISRIFFNGPPSVPDEATDMNCDGVPDATDLNIIIQVLFFNLQAPPNCGDGPGT